MQPKTTLKTRNHAAFRLHYHAVFVIKYRHPVVTANMMERLRDVFADVLAKWGCELVELDGEADHVHLLFEAHPALDLSRLIGNLNLQLQRAIAGAATAPAIIDAVARSWGRARTLAALDTGCREAAEDAAARREALLVDLAQHLDMRITRRAVCRHAPTWRDAAAVVENCDDDGRTGV